MKIYPIITKNALRNIFYIIGYGNKKALVIDPCDSELTKEFLEKHNFKLEKIYITHEHYDHYEGVDGLGCSEIWASKIASNNMPVTATHIFSNGEIFFENEEFSLKALASPGHAAGHMMFELTEKKHVENTDLRSGSITAIFTGDVLFQGGVGHTRNGSSEDLYNSVQLLEKYDDNISLYPGHDYLKGNIEFAKTHAPHKLEALLEMQKLSQDGMTFTKLFQERSINPFVGVSKSEFTKLRELKNNF